MNLIITPVWKAYDIVFKMCEAIDNNTVYPFFHILIDDDSRLDESFPVKITRNRHVITIGRDFVEPNWKHQNGLSQAVQLGYDYSHYRHENAEERILPYDHVFLVESDILVKPEWDKKMIDLIPSLPDDWASLDTTAVDEKGNITYPTAINVPIKHLNDQLAEITYVDFQTSLFNNEVLPEKSGVKFSDFRSHSDILWSRKITEITGKKHYRAKQIYHFHYGSQSRQFLK